MSHHFSVFLSVLVQVSRLAPVFLLVPGFRTELESAFHLGMALPTVLEFRLELVPGFHLEMAPASRLDSGLPVSPLESDPLSVLAFPVLLAPLWKRHFHPEMVRTVLLLVSRFPVFLQPEQRLLLCFRFPFHFAWPVHPPDLSAFPAPFSLSPLHAPVQPNREAFRLPRRTLLPLCQIFSLKSYMFCSPLCCLSISACHFLLLRPFG